MAVKKIENNDDISSEERLRNLKANAERNRELREQAKANRDIESDDEEDDRSTQKDLEKSLERAHKDREYRERFDKKNLKFRKKQDKVRKEVWESEQDRKYKQFMAETEEPSEKRTDQTYTTKTENARRSKEYAEAKKESIEASRELSHTKKKAFCEDHPHLCRIRYGKKTRNKLLEKEEDDDGLDMRMFQGSPSNDFGEQKKESAVTVNINQGGYPATVQTPQREPPTRDYPVYDSPSEPKRGTREKKEKKNPPRSSRKKSSKSSSTSVVKKSTAKKTNTKTNSTKSTRKSDDDMPAAFSSTPAKRRTPSKVKQSKPVAKGKGTRSNTTKSKTVKKTTAKKKSPPKSGWWGDGDAGLFD